METWLAVLCGCGGAGLAEIWGLMSFRKSTWRGLPDYLKDWWFWVVGAFGVAAAAFVTMLYAVSSPEHLTPLLAANVGATWPLVIRVGGQKVSADQGSVNDAVA